MLVSYVAFIAHVESFRIQHIEPVFLMQARVSEELVLMFLSTQDLCIW